MQKNKTTSSSPLLKSGKQVMVDEQQKAKLRLLFLHLLALPQVIRADLKDGVRLAVHIGDEYKQLGLDMAQPDALLKVLLNNPQLAPQYIEDHILPEVRELIAGVFEELLVAPPAGIH